MRKITLLFLLFGFVSLPVWAADTITVGTFNIQHLGDNDHPLRYEKIAKICQGVDILAIQEVHEEGNAVAKLAAVMGDEYRFSVSEVTTHERFAFIWRAPVKVLKPAQFADGLNLGRRPYVGFFKAGNFDFQLMTVHLFWEGSKKTYPHTRFTELKLLDDWIARRTDEELDLIILGDFNEPHQYYGYSVYPPSFSSHAFFYEFINRHGYVSVTLEKRIPTSIVNKNIYDHILFNPNRYFAEEFAGFDSARVIRWEREYDADNDDYMDYPEYEKAKNEVSDHRVVTAEFRIDMADDDEVD